MLTVGLPLARPALAAGLSLVLLECLNDIGAVEFFGVRTMAVGVYTTWLGRGDLHGAAQIACVLLVFAVALIGLERIGQRGQSVGASRQSARPPTPARLTGGQAALALLICAAPLLLGLILPRGDPLPICLGAP